MTDEISDEQMHDEIYRMIGRLANGISTKDNLAIVVMAAITMAQTILMNDDIDDFKDAKTEGARWLLHVASDVAASVNIPFEEALEILKHQYDPVEH
jgi:hypothetical protein